VEASGHGAFHFLGSGTAKTGRHARPSTLGAGRPTGWPRKNVPFLRYIHDLRYGAGVELGYARVSTVKQDLDRQIDALEQVGIPRDRIYVDKKSGATTDRPGLRGVIACAREGDVIVVHTLDRLGRTVRDTLNLIHELAERKVGVRNLADPIKVDSSNPDDPMAQLAVVLLALFGQMERTYTMERAAHARAVATAKGRRIGRPVLVDPAKLDYAAHLRDSGHTIAEIVTKTGIPGTSLYRHLPPRPAPTVTAADITTSAENPSRSREHKPALTALGSTSWVPPTRR
jgi:DNA invertase Pin-like site-specific DNA recombinase